MESDFWKDHTRARSVSEKIALIKKELSDWEEIKLELLDLETYEKFDESRFKDLEKKIRAKEIEVFFSGKYDRSPALVSFYSGAGGDDAEDWARMLLRMFTRWAEKRKFQIGTLHLHQSEDGGVKNASIEIKGLFAYGLLKGESGVHRLVRISPFNAQKLRHTSFALVEVLPEITDPEELKINPEEVKVEFFRSSGPGGQNVNKRETAVRLIHIPTGLAVTCQSERSQERNREAAMQLLKAKLWELKRKETDQERQSVKKEVSSIEWGHQIRSYVLHPYKMVKDHRTLVETSQVEKVLDGELDEFIDAEVRGIDKSNNKEDIA